MLDTLKALLGDQIKDLYSAESQLLKALPKMAKAANRATLRGAFESHLKETRGHLDRLQQIAVLLETKPGGKKCKAMAGLVEEGGEAVQEKGADAVLDAGLIAAAQRIEHYEISAYGSARAMATQLGEPTIVKLLQATLDEECAADHKLTAISIQEVLPATPDAAAASTRATKPSAR